MVIPVRMNTVPIVIEQLTLVTTNTPLDQDFGEIQSGRKKRYNTINVNGQVVYEKFKEEEVALTGDPSRTIGHLTFRKFDIDNAGIILKKGDIVKSIAGVATNFRFIDVRPSGHLRGVSNLWMAYFAENRETNPSLRR
jgi:hypothetical protein